MGCDLELRLIYSPHLTDFGAMSADWVCKIALLYECLLASRLACSAHLTDFGVCLRIELACLLAGTDLGKKEEEVYLRLVGCGIFVQRSEKAFAESLGGCLLADQHKMGGGGDANAMGWIRRRCTNRPEKD